MSGVLDGVRVLDFSVGMVGPFACMQLGAMGADVILIRGPEPPTSTGPGPNIKGMAANYICWNMNKRSVVLGMKDERDRQVAYEIARKCDVFVTNMRPGAVDRLGIGYDRISEINPRIVYVYSPGWGSSGPMVDVPGADTYHQFFCGMVSVNGTPGGRPEAYRHYTQNDGTTSSYIVQAVLLGLLARDKTGKGQKIETSMLNAAVAVQTTRIAEHFASGEQPPLMGSASATTVPHQAFLSQDKQWVAVGVENPEQWPAFCRVLHLEDLAGDPRFRTNRDRVVNRDELVPLLEEVFRNKPRYYWIMELTAAGVPAGKFMDWDEIRFHPQTTENRHIMQVDTPWGPVYMGGPPYHFSEDETRMTSAPEPGAHTREVKDELNLTPGGRRDLTPGPSPLAERGGPT